MCCSCCSCRQLRRARAECGDLPVQGPAGSLGLAFAAFSISDLLSFPEWAVPTRDYQPHKRPPDTPWPLPSPCLRGGSGSHAGNHRVLTDVDQLADLPRRSVLVLVDTSVIRASMPPVARSVRSSRSPRSSWSLVAHRWTYLQRPSGRPPIAPSVRALVLRACWVTQAPVGCERRQISRLAASRKREYNPPIVLLLL
jgi:hypothetical protein